MNKLTFFLAILLSICFNLNAQDGKVGINTENPSENLHIVGTIRIENLPVSGTDNSIYTINNSTSTNGTTSSKRDQTFTQDKVLVVDQNGVIGKASMPSISSTGPKTFIAGRVLVKYNSSAGGTLDPSKVIGGGTGINYNIGTTSGTSTIGGLVSIIGTGYKVSQVASGVYDIMLDKPFNEIFSLNANLYDTGTGTTPDTTKPYTNLSTLDQVQISYMDTKIIRIITGNSTGNKSARSFTFSVTGD